MRKKLFSPPRAAWLCAAALCAWLCALLCCRAEPGDILPVRYPTLEIMPKLNVHGPQPGGTETPWTVRALCYVDTALYNPLNAGDYTLEDGRPFFDFVVLGAAQIKKDDKGAYLYFPPDLQTLLDRRNTYLYPLQARGIKVLLGLTGGQDNVTFGSLDLEAYHQDPETLDYATEYPRFANLIKGFLDVYDLDGVEFNDADAATPGTSESVYPDKRASLYGTSKQEEREKYWKEGGEIMCNLCYELWELCEADNQDNDMEDYERRDKKYIIVRQKNFGRYLPRNVPGSPNNPVFWGSDTVIDYVSFSATVAADFTSGSFWGDSVIPSWETTPVFVRKLYGPLVVNLAGASGPVPTVAKMEEYSARYTVNESGNPQSPGDYGLVCFHNLRPVSEAASDSAFAVLDGGTDDTKQADYLSIFSRAVFDCKTVLRQGGGDYAKDW